MNYTDRTLRRAFFKQSATGTLALSTAVPLLAALMQSCTDEVSAAPMSGIPKAANEKEFREGVIGPAQLSLLTSQIAVDKATNRNAKEFAGFELTEAIAVLEVLKDLNTPIPAFDAEAQATLTKIQTTPAGLEFDKAYIQAQLKNHEFLRDLAMDYLQNAAGKTEPAEKEGRHLATLSLAVYKEHVAITRRILTELGG